MADWLECEADVLLATVPRKRSARDEFLATVGEGLRSDAELIKTLRMEIDQQQRLRAMALAQALALKRERDMLAIAVQERTSATMLAEAVAAAILARADEDGAMHRDAMIEVLITMGAR